MELQLGLRDPSMAARLFGHKQWVIRVFANTVMTTLQDGHCDRPTGKYGRQISLRYLEGILN